MKVLQPYNAQPAPVHMIERWVDPRDGHRYLRESVGTALAGTLILGTTHATGTDLLWRGRRSPGAASSLIRLPRCCRHQGKKCCASPANTRFSASAAKLVTFRPGGWSDWGVIRGSRARLSSRRGLAEGWSFFRGGDGMAKDVAWSDPILHGWVVLLPQGKATQSLPVLYLLHGIRDTPETWLSEQRGQLRQILGKAQAPPMIIVMLANGTVPVGLEPQLVDVMRHFAAVRAHVNLTYQPDLGRQGLLGISMGAKQALRIVLDNADITVLALLSGMFQEPHLRAVVGDDPQAWQTTRGQSLGLYFHYCGAHADTQQPNGRPQTGDLRFLASNELVCERLGGHLRRNREGKHNWNFWRPELTDFFWALSQTW
jgi:enterochelin esterase-like enzyme